MLSGPQIFQEESKKLIFTSALAGQYTVCNFQDFMAHCVPQLVNGYQKRKPKRQQRGTRKKKALDLKECQRQLRRLERTGDIALVSN
jgi:hypothetical protein